jgi:hypothetical protein
VISWDTLPGIKSNAQLSKLDGKYTFIDLKKGHHYTLTLTKNEQTMDGINVDDVIVLLRHILGTEKLTTSSKLIAADVNHDKIISIEDFNLLYDVVFGRKNTNQIPIHWHFIPSGFIFTDPLNPFNTQWPTEIEFICPDQSLTSVNFTAIRVGELDDVNMKPQTTVSRNSNSQASTINWHRVYPNPVSGEKIQFEFFQKVTGVIQLELYNIQGTILKREARSFDKGLNNWELILPEGMAPGVLFYRLGNQEHVYRGKLKVIR